MKKICKSVITIAMIMVLCLIWGNYSYAREMDDGYRMPEWELKGNTVIISGQERLNNSWEALLAMLKM